MARTPQLQFEAHRQMRLFYFMMGFLSPEGSGGRRFPMKECGNGQLFSAVLGAIGICTEAGQLRELVYRPPSFPEQAPRAARQIERSLRQPDFRSSLLLAHEGITHF